jgi:hypothetical protein
MQPKGILIMPAKTGHRAKPAKSAREKVNAHRKRMRAKGLPQVQM